MKQRGVKKLIPFFLIFMVLLMISGIFALSKDSEDFILSASNELGEKNITSIKKIDFDSAPEQVDIQQIDKTHLSIYELDTGKEGDKPIFMITFAEEYIPMITQKYFSKYVFSFGSTGKLSNSQYLQLSNGMKGDLNKGYVMMQKGSITGISTLVDIDKSDSGNLQLIIYKNGKEVGFRNVLDSSSSGIKKDYDIQSKDLITFNPGDIVSVYVKFPDGVIVNDILTNLEVVTD